MIPRDIETTDQWQVRFTPPGGPIEVTRTGTEVQMRGLVRMKADCFPILERRTITVGPWKEVDPNASNTLEAEKSEEDE